MTIGEKIKKHRKEIGISQNDLGKRLGVSQAMIAQYENGKRTPKLETLQKITSALGISLFSFFAEILDDGTTWLNLSEVDEINSNYDNFEKYIYAIFPHFKKHKDEKSMEESIQQMKADFLENERIKILMDNYYKLNNSGQKEAIKRVEELTEIPRYTKPDESSQE